MLLFSRAYKNLIKGCSIRNKNWPEDYFIYKKESSIKDSMGNTFAEDVDEFFECNSIVFDNAGAKWEIYDEVKDINL
jgi:hypothetical protein